MDQFLCDIYFSVFKEWVKGKLGNEVIDVDNELIRTYSNAKVRVVFNEMNIIELEVTNLKHNTVEFYLHFQMQNLLHATSLYAQLEETVHSIESRKTMNVLLSCTGGLTTSFFAESLNETARSMNLDYHFDAVAFTNLLRVGHEYNVILLAPQIAYQLPKVSSVLSDKIITDIPGTLFASYNAVETIRLVEEKIRQKNKEKISVNIDISGKIHNEKKILTIACIRHRHHSFMYYRIYDHNEVLEEKTIVKPTLSICDFDDVLHTVFLNHSDIIDVGIAIPGMIDEEGLVTGSFYLIGDFNYASYFKKKYSDKNFYIMNETNAAVVGMNVEHDEYKNMSIYLLGKNHTVGGVASVVNNQLIVGKQGIAGEIRWHIGEQEYDEDFINKAGTVEGTVEIVAHNLLPLITILGPEMIGISSDMIPYVDEVKKELTKRIPEKYLPEFIKIKDIQEYMLVGLLKLMLQ